MSLLILFAGFAVTALSCELWLRSRKLQSALTQVALVHGIGLAVTAGILVPDGHLRVTPVLIFWAGAALAWFGVRSHLESSILLRMIHILRGGALTRADVNRRYEAAYGQARRVDELRRAGLLSTDAGGRVMTLTRKGVFIARLIVRLR